MGTSDQDALLRRNRELTILQHIAETLNRTTDLQMVLDETLASVVELLGLQTGWIFLLDDQGALYTAAYHGLPPALQDPATLPIWRGGCNCHTLFRHGELRTAVNIVECSRLAEAAGDRRGLVFHASAPLRSDERLLGILNVAAPGNDIFTPDILLLLSAVGAQLGTAIERARLAQQAVALAAAEERNRIAREIHDTLAQGLAAIALHLEAAEALTLSQPEKARRKIRQALDLARANLEEARRSVLNLRAAPLEGRTLPAALRLLAQQWTAETGVPLVTAIDSRIGQLTPAVETGLYRVAQEALTNVRKHAHARQAWLRLERSAGLLRLSIEDDGRGFDPGQIRPDSFGLKGMSERAHLLGGRFEVCSTPGAGTRVTIAVPDRMQQENGL
ncbi:GAF domain-containing sensor histidine kinase [Kallotenue papyrolyticum]|uniref:GAF domain-containing sensor histidine kinase n=1 Tax=Kallotenue papyrolyticum TaxID=1325125 RepID=UPI0004785B45|nr:GAF domain-containing sensor histidine kinase [Kallotenue papyrolyticum]